MPFDAPAGAGAELYGAHLDWLDCLVEREILRLRARYELSLDELRGLYISDAQVDRLLMEKVGGAPALDPPAELSARAARVRAQCIDPEALADLGRRFALSRLELDLVLLALAPELDLRYATFYAYLNNDVARRYLTLDLACRLLRGIADDPAAEAMRVRAALGPPGTLPSASLLEPVQPENAHGSLERGWTLAPLAAQFLLGLPLADPGWPEGVRWLDGGDRRARPARGLHVYSGDDHQALRERAFALGSARGAGVLALPFAVLAAPAADVSRPMLAARLAGATVVVEDDDAIPIRDPAALEAVARAIRTLQTRVEVAWLKSPRAPWPAGLGDIAHARIDVPPAGVAAREAAWSRALASAGLDGGVELPRRLAATFRLSTCAIEAVASSVAMMTPADRAGASGVAHAMRRMARCHSDPALQQLATRVEASHRWEDLVLAEGMREQLREIAAAIVERDRVYGEWGMAGRSGRSTGLIALFTGASGTGKSMAAAVIAHEAGLHLYRVDLAAVVSKYIGETEKSLDRIFEAARGSNAVVLMDEADALLGKRSEVQDAHDRYANIEVAYLLQKLEDHDGAVILSSNLPKNIDSAFARRIHYSLEFARPHAALRERLWRAMFPRTVPLATDIDFRFLAEAFDVTGGEIRAMALDAAFMAAAAQRAVSMEQLMRAVTRRQTRQGHPGSQERFARWASTQPQPLA